ncbi:MAG: hypothetical protein JSU94_11620 [Phycisphaerales bacterium]|nr:MAG: hypothetical protein JSU94_11620 [Phycisphaerales bacterium]
MLNVFEQPWTLVGAAVLVLFGLLTFRSFMPEKRRPWQWLLPLAVAALGFGLDALVQTDIERIDALIKTGADAVRRADFTAIASIIAEDYSDSVNAGKADLIRRVRGRLARPIVEKIRRTGRLVELSSPAAKVTLFAKVTFTDDSFVARDYKKWILVKLRLYLRKDPARGWLINRVEILEIDKQPVNWRAI